MKEFATQSCRKLHKNTIHQKMIKEKGARDSKVSRGVCWDYLQKGKDYGDDTTKRMGRNRTNTICLCINWVQRLEIS